jgi:hypothetical protein
LNRCTRTLLLSPLTIVSAASPAVEVQSIIEAVAGLSNASSAGDVDCRRAFDSATCSGFIGDQTDRFRAARRHRRAPPAQSLPTPQRHVAELALALQCCTPAIVRVQRVRRRTTCVRLQRHSRSPRCALLRTFHAAPTCVPDSYHPVASESSRSQNVARAAV